MPTDLALGADCFDGGGDWPFNAPDSATDGNVVTAALTNAFYGSVLRTAHLVCDLGSATNVGSMLVLGAWGSGGGGTYDPQWAVAYASSPSGPFTAVTGFSRTFGLDNGAGIAYTTMAFDAETARYWRITWSRNPGGYSPNVYVFSWSIYEEEVEPDPPIEPGIEVTINGTFFEHPKDVTFRVVRNAAGQGSVILDRHDPQATAAILVPGSLVTVKIPEIDPDEPIFGFLLEDGDWDLVSSDEEGGEELRFSGPGALFILDRCRIDWVEYEDGIGLPKPVKGYWEFLANDTEGQILNKLMREATSASRPQHPIAGVTWDFDSVGDSNAPPEDWDNVVFEGKWRVPIGASLYDEVIRLVAAGLMSVEMGPDLVLHAYRTTGVDRTGDFGPDVVRFEKGVNIADELVRSQAGRDFASHGLGRYGDGSYTRAPKDGSWPYVQERFFDGLQTTHENTAKRMMKGNLGWLEAAQDAPQFAHIVPWPGAGNDEANGIYLPGPRWSANGKYWVGDLVTLHTGTGELDYNEASFRVAAITIRLDETGFVAPPIVELGAEHGSAGTARSSGGVTNPGGTSSGGSGGGGGTGGSGTPTAAYQPLAEKGVASGYASLDASALVPYTELGTGGDGSGDNVLHDDQTWAPATPGDLDDLGDVNAPTPGDGDVLTWDASPGEWVAAAPSGGVAELDDVGDVNAPTPSDGQVLTWDASPGEWVAASPAGGFAAHSVAAAGATCALGTAAYTTVSFTATDLWDTDAYHNPSSNPDQFVIPTGLGGAYFLFVKLHITIDSSNSGADVRIAYNVNGGGDLILFRTVGPLLTGSGTVHVLSAGEPIVVAQGDVIRIRGYTQTANNDVTGGYAMLTKQT